MFVWDRPRPLCDVPKLGIGNKPADGGNYLFTAAQKDEFLEREPGAEKYFHRWYGSQEFIKGIERWVLWLGDATAADLQQLPHCRARIEAVRQFRLSRKSAPTRQLAARPHRFHVENMLRGQPSRP